MDGVLQWLKVGFADEISRYIAATPGIVEMNGLGND
jgi:hypothetical protein